MKAKKKTIDEIKCKSNICFDCKKAVGLCSWSEVTPSGEIRFQPPEGAVFEEVEYKFWDRNGVTMSITQCPLFDPDEGYDRQKLCSTLPKVDRGQIIAAFDMGLSTKDICKKLGIQPCTVYYWKKRLIEEGVFRGGKE